MLRCLPILLALATAGRAEASAVQVHYGVSLLGLTIGTATLTGTIEPSGYKLGVDARVSGLASALSSLRTAASASGTLSGGRVLPAGYAVTSANTSTTRTIRMALDSGTVTGLEIVPPWDPDVPRVPITEAQKAHVLDPLSALVATLPVGAPFGPDVCDRTLPIFDGGVRFDLALTPAGTRHVSIKGFDGEAAVCTARYVPISGQRVESRSSRFMAENRNLEGWLVLLPGTRVAIPYRVSVKTTIGTVVIEAEEITVKAPARAAGQ